MAEDQAITEVVKQGIFLYDGSVVCDIRIIRSNMLHGYFQGEWVDSGRMMEDAEGPLYFIEYGTSTQRGEYSTKSFAYTSLNEALQQADVSTGGTVRWDDPGET